MQTEFPKADPADLHLVAKHRDRIRAVVPEICERMRRSGRSGVLVGDKEHSIGEAFLHDTIKLAVLPVFVAALLCTALAPLVVLVVALGVYPVPVLQLLEAPVDRIIDAVNGAGVGLGPLW